MLLLGVNAMASANLSPLLVLSHRGDRAGHHARVNILRSLLRKGILREARLGFVEGISPDDVENCLSGEDANEVQADLCRDPMVAQLLPHQLPTEEFGRWKTAIAHPGQMALF